MMQATAVGAPVQQRPRKGENPSAFQLIQPVIAAATVYETLAGVNDRSMTEAEMQEHKVRMARAAKLMDLCLDKLESL